MASPEEKLGRARTGPMYLAAEGRRAQVNCSSRGGAIAGIHPGAARAAGRSTSV